MKRLVCGGNLLIGFMSELVSSICDRENGADVGVSLR